jgi:hypothetical protein
MSWRILNAWKGQHPVIQTALDDLESFLWVLIWCIVHISKDIKGATIANEGIESMLRGWSGELLSKTSAIEREWKDTVFGDVIQQWLHTFRKADLFNAEITKAMSAMRLGSQEWHDTCNELELYCNSIYKVVFESGFRNLEGVKEYSSWVNVVAANERSRHDRKRRQ